MKFPFVYYIIEGKYYVESASVNYIAVKVTKTVDSVSISSPVLKANSDKCDPTLSIALTLMNRVGILETENIPAFYEWKRLQGINVYETSNRVKHLEDVKHFAKNSKIKISKDVFSNRYE